MDRQTTLNSRRQESCICTHDGHVGAAWCWKLFEVICRGKLSSKACVIDIADGDSDNDNCDIMH